MRAPLLLATRVALSSSLLSFAVVAPSAAIAAPATSESSPPGSTASSVTCAVSLLPLLLLTSLLLTKHTRACHCRPTLWPPLQQERVEGAPAGSTR